MKTGTRFIIRGALAALLAGGVTFVVLKQNAVVELRTEHAALLDVQVEAERLTSENQEIERLRAENEEVKRLRTANEDLLRLRNEHHQLDHQVQELGSLRAVNELLKSRLTNNADAELIVQGSRTVVNGVFWPTNADGGPMAQPTNMFSRVELKDSGAGLPRAALQTYYWAMCAGDLERFRQCLTPAAAAAFANETDESFRQRMAVETAGFTGFEVTGRNVAAPDEIVLEIRLFATGENRQMRFKQVGREWKINP